MDSLTVPGADRKLDDHEEISDGPSEAHSEVPSSVQSEEVRDVCDRFIEDQMEMSEEFLHQAQP